MKKISSAFVALAGFLFIFSCQVESFITLESPSKISAGAEGMSATVSLKSNTDWSASPDCDWVILHNGSGTAGICSFSLSILPNTSLSERHATVTIQGAGASKTVSISQEASSGTSSIQIPEGYAPTVRISHKAELFTAPLMEYGSSLPMVDWGDGSAESYCTALEHFYQGSGVHTVTIYSDDISAFTISDLTDIESVETLNFRK